MWGLLLVLQVAVNPGHEKPSALIAFENARKQIVKADIDWVETNFRGDYAGRPFYHRTRSSHNDVINIYTETENGVTGVRGETGEEMKQGPQGTLREDNGENFWRYGGAMVAQKWVDERATQMTIFDYRAIGMLPVPRLVSAVEECLWNWPGNPGEIQFPRTYQQEIVGGIHKVTMSQDDKKVVWYISPELGWNATECEYYVKGKQIISSTTEYELHEKTWVPIQTAFFSGDDLFQMTHATRIKINTEDLPDELDPTDIGLENGLNVVVQNGPNLGGYIWADYDLIKAKEYMHLLRANAIQNGPSLRGIVHPTAQTKSKAREHYRSIVISADRNISNDPWERYTLKFIQQYKLDKEQSEKAMLILREAQAERYKYLQIISFNHEYAKGNEKGSEKEARYRLRILNVLEGKLKPRLDRIPTRSQRKRAEIK